VKREHLLKVGQGHCLHSIGGRGLLDEAAAAVPSPDEPPSGLVLTTQELPELRRIVTICMRLRLLGRFCATLNSAVGAHDACN
jgi:hypothetical protein